MQAAAAAVLLLAAGLALAGRWLPPRTALLRSAVEDHIEDVIDRQAKVGWVADESEAEKLAQAVVGDARPVRAFTPPGYRLARARMCSLEGKREHWLHLIYTGEGRELSFFVRGSPTQGYTALPADPRVEHIKGYEAAGTRRSALGIVFVGDVSEADSIRLLRTAAQSIS